MVCDNCELHKEELEYLQEDFDEYKGIIKRNNK